jgi:hypothetical protein
MKRTILTGAIILASLCVTASDVGAQTPGRPFFSPWESCD